MLAEPAMPVPSRTGRSGPARMGAVRILTAPAGTRHGLNQARPDTARRQERSGQPRLRKESMSIPYRLSQRWICIRSLPSSFAMAVTLPW